MKKKLFAGLLALRMVLSLMPIAALAADDTPAEGYSKDTAWDISAVPGTDDVKAWLSLNDDGETYTLYIEGTGAGMDFTSDSARPYNSVRDQITEVLIGDEVTRLGARTFQFVAIREINLPASIAELDIMAFGGMQFLEEITVERGNRAYYTRDGVLFTMDGKTLVKYPAAKPAADYEIPGRVKTLSRHALSKASFTELTLPNGLETIDAYAFQGTKASELVIPDSVTTLAGGAFYQTSIDVVTIGSGITAVEPTAFQAANVKEVYFSEDSKLTEIGDRAFSNCSQLEKIEIPGTIETILRYAFQNCYSLVSVAAEGVAFENLKSFGNYTTQYFPNGYSGAFLENKALTKFPFSPDSPITVILSTAFGAANGGVGCSGLESLIIPSAVTEIQSSAFSGCVSLHSVYFAGNNVSSIGNNAFGSQSSGLCLPADAIVYHNMDSLVDDVSYSGAKLKDRIQAKLNEGGFDADTEFSADEFAEPTRAGYEFLGWYTADGTDDKWGSKVSAPVDGVNVYYAKWKELKPCGVSIVSDTDSLDGDGVVTLTVSVADDALDEGEVEVSCDDKRVFIFENRDGTYSAYLPDITKTYTFTAKYTSQAEGEDRAFDNGEDSCEISVTGTDNEPPVTDPEEEEEDDEPVYRIKIDAGRHGEVTTKPSGASEGTTITIYVEPDKGYALDELIVTDRDGNEIELEDMGDGRYRFRMPDSKVNIEASFKKAKEEVKIVLTVGSTTATVNGETVTTDAAPVIVNGRTMLPIRFIAEALGAEVEWVETERKVIITKGDTNIVIFIGSEYAYINGEAVKLDAAAFIEGNRTYLPLRFVAEALGAEVVWDPDTRTVTVTGTK